MSFFFRLWVHPTEKYELIKSRIWFQLLNVPNHRCILFSCYSGCCSVAFKTNPCKCTFEREKEKKNNFCVLVCACVRVRKQLCGVFIFMFKWKKMKTKCGTFNWLISACVWVWVYKVYACVRTQMVLEAKEKIDMISWVASRVLVCIRPRPIHFSLSTWIHLSILLQISDWVQSEWCMVVGDGWIDISVFYLLFV